MNDEILCNMMRSLKVCFPFFLFFTLLTFLVKDHAFFFDTVQLASRHAHWYFDNNFRFFFPPESFDSGHSPFFGMLLASAWKIFGKSLWVSHFLILPFLLGCVYLLHYLGEYFLGKGKSVYLLLLVAVDPFFIGQSILVSPDILLVFGWLLALWCIIEHRKVILIIATIFLAAISLRGMMVVFSLFLFEVFRLYNNNFSWKSLIKTFDYYLPSGLLSLIFFYFHYKHTGWIGYHENSPWAPTFERVDFAGFIYNIGLVGWRLLDFGRVFLWIFIGWGVFKMIKDKIHLSVKFKELLVLMFVLLLVLTPSMLIHLVVKAHRYLLPVALIIDIIALKVLFLTIPKNTVRKTVCFALVVGLMTGNLWVYPKHIAQGWDSTLAHWPYYSLRTEMIQYIDKNQIPIESVGTEFPMIGNMELLDLNGREEGFHEKDFEKDSYILYSNVFNDFSDEELEKLEKDFVVVKELKRTLVCMILYKRKE